MADNLASSSKMNTKGKYQRLATPRELFFGLRTDGTVLSNCVCIKIFCREEVSREKFESCVQYFNKNTPCFREYLTEGKDDDFWVSLQEESTYEFQEFVSDKLNLITTNSLIANILNSRYHPENTASWDFYYTYKGKSELYEETSTNNPHLYELIFCFHTATLDDYSCALICNLFLNNLDCAIKDKQMPVYSEINLYDIGTKINQQIYLERLSMHRNTQKYLIVGSYGEIFSPIIGNFTFPSSHMPTKPIFKTSELVLSESKTNEFFITCDDIEISVYAYVIAIFNNVLLSTAQKSDINTQEFRIKILHNINSKWIYRLSDPKYEHQVGSHMIPFMQFISVYSLNLQYLLEQALKIEDTLEALIGCNAFASQEVLRHYFINQATSKYKSGSWNPKYFYSICNLGNLDFVFQEHQDNSFYSFKYERARAVQDDIAMDIKFYVFKGRLNFSIDYCTKFVSENEVKKILKGFNEVVSLLIDSNCD